MIINKNKSLIDSKQNNGDNSTSFLMKWEQWEQYSLFEQWFWYILKILEFLNIYYWLLKGFMCYIHSLHRD